MERAVEASAAPDLDLASSPIPHPKGRAMHEPDQYVSIFPQPCLQLSGGQIAIVYHARLAVLGQMLTRQLQ